MKIYFITGASGVGKTTLVSNLKEKYQGKKDWVFLHFDSVGVPSAKEMQKITDSGKNWQRETTKFWIEKMLKEYNGEETIIFEGQVKLEFIKDEFQKQEFFDYEIVLIDCDEETMGKRLIDGRNRSKLFNKDMKNWLKFLREQAKDFKVKTIDTSKMNENEVLRYFENRIL